MNFATVPTIPAAIIARASHPLYGYFLTPDAYYDAIIGWQRDRNGVEGLTKDAIGYENGVLGGVASALGCLAAPATRCCCTAPPISASPAVWRTTATASYTARWCRTRTAPGGWTTPTWTANAKKTIHAAIFLLAPQPCGRVWERWKLKGHGRLPRKRRDRHLRRDLVRYHPGGHKHPHSVRQ